MVASIPNNNPGHHWDGWGLRDGELRRIFSMQTCTGCHCGDTSTAFFHVVPRELGEEARVSDFLRTDGSRLRLKDPANRKGFITSEMADRVKLIEAVLNPDRRLSEVRKLKASRGWRVH